MSSSISTSTTIESRDLTRPSLSRPLSELSENEQHKRGIIKSTSSNRSSVHSIYNNNNNKKDKSRPVSVNELKEAEILAPITSNTNNTTLASPITTTINNNHNNTNNSNTNNMSSSSKRISIGGNAATTAQQGGGVQTITLNLVEYAKSQSQPQSQPQLRQPQPSSQSSPQPLLPQISHSEPQPQNGSDKTPQPTSASNKPIPSELPKRPSSFSSKKGKDKEKEKTHEKKVSPRMMDKELPETGESSGSGVSSFLLAKRASLRPSSLSISYAEVAKPVASPPAATDSLTTSAFDSVDSLRTSSSITDVSKPATKSKPSWLRRASGTAALRSKSRTPPPKEDPSLPTSTSLPPALPPRKGLESMAEVPTSQSLPEEGMAPPPFPPRKNSYANVTAAGPSRSRLGEGQGRPAFSPASSSSGPPPLPPRDNIGNIRGKIAAWTAAAAQSSGGGFSRSESSTSIQTQSGAGSSFGPAQRIPSSAQRVLGHAGSAVQKGWAGLRSRGVGGSISSIQSLGQSSRRGNGGFEPSNSWGSGLSNRRGSRDRSRSDNYEFGYGAPPPSDGPVFEPETVRRHGDGITGKVFGRDVIDAGKEWGVVDDIGVGDDLNDYERRRRKCLPAVVVRSVEYLQIWGPKEEGIFRISGRNSHIARLRKEFDSGADIDLLKCHPGDLDPHAVAGLFKSYLRDLPSPLLTHHLAPRFDAYVKGKGRDSTNRATFDSTKAEDGHLEQPEDLKSLLQQLPQAHWFLLADIVKLLDLIPRHASTNRMTQNALMLSLGPSLIIPGGILNELIENREVLFAEPPSPSNLETAEALIDFGDITIPPVTPLSERASTPLSYNTDDRSPLPQSMGSTKSKKAPRLPAKPSLTKIFTSSSTISLPRQKSVDTLNSISNAEPPRVDIPISPASPLPTFEPSPLPSNSNSQEPTPKPAPKPLSLKLVDDESIPDTPLTSTSDKMEEIYDPSDERSRSLSTPIADRFQGTSSPFPPLRQPRSSNGSTLTINSSASDGNLSRTAQIEATNPAQVIRRGAPVFFSSAAVTGGHTRSASASATNLLSGGSGSGLKRKDGAGDGENRKSDDSEDSEKLDNRREKRLSAGLDNPRIREYTV